MNLYIQKKLKNIIKVSFGLRMRVRDNILGIEIEWCPNNQNNNKKKNQTHKILWEPYIWLK